MSNLPRVILWDVMDTLVRDPFRDAMPGFFGLTLQEFLAAKHNGAWGSFERGELSEAEFLSRLFQDGRAYDQLGFKACIRGAYAWIAGIEELLGELRARAHAMHVLSNYPEWHAWIEERLALSRYVCWTFVSCRMGLRKPDPEIFLRAARELGLQPEQCLFIDDRANNCDAARGVGMRALHFQGDVPALRAELKRLELL
jgi:HAD superfamily hydrolase (TIGR01509 family)